jgi:hypothetical protein
MLNNEHNLPRPRSCMMCTVMMVKTRNELSGYPLKDDIDKGARGQSR